MPVAFLKSSDANDLFGGSAVNLHCYSSDGSIAEIILNSKAVNLNCSFEFRIEP